MNRTIILIISLLLINSISLNAQQTRVIAECTIEYLQIKDSTIISENPVTQNSDVKKIVYIKANHSRVDVISEAIHQTVLYDQVTGEAVILRELGNNKFITKLDKTKWLSENEKFENATQDITNEEKIILGYKCNKVMFNYPSGVVATIYYTKEIIPSVKAYEYQFKEVAGMVLGYQISDAKKSSVNFIATKIDFSPVPTSVFTIPTSGYRLLN